MVDSITFDHCIVRLAETVCCLVQEADFSQLRVVRDMDGRLYLTVPDEWSEDTIGKLRDQLSTTLGPYSPGVNSGVARYNETLAGESLIHEPSLLQWVDDTGVHIVERRAMGQDWVVQPSLQNDAHPPRFVFHSLKGGVGRSTALMLWGRDLVRQGYTVLLLDLDLEAPGLGPHMLSAEAHPDYGLLDWLVEDLVGNASRSIVSEMVAESPLVDQPGLWVAPAVGAKSKRYPDNVVAKLARAYLEGDDGSSFARRLQRMVAALEHEIEPDVVLVDSRAGLHETVASNLLHLNAEVFFFAVDVPATWEGYRYLFSHLAQLASTTRKNGDHVDWRFRFHMVHARASMKERDKRKFASSAYGVWVDTLYDASPVPVELTDDEEAMFTFDENDPEAPHWPLSILRSDHFEAFDPVEQLADVGEHAIREAFGELFAGLQSYLTLLTERSG